MTWTEFVFFAIAAMILWIWASLRSFLKRKKAITIAIYFLGILVYSSFIIAFWISLDRPPLRTLGETRLWYSFFLAIAGLITYWRWNYKWILSYSTMMAAVFMALNILKPEIHSQSLVPVLQSPWFIPHVSIYIFSYAFFACCFIMSLTGLCRPKLKLMESIDRLSIIALSFFTIGMLMGSMWAKQAWGDFWTWDPKECWAAATWFAYLFYFHARRSWNFPDKWLYLVQCLAFVCLQICWYGLNWLPSASQSMHNYAQ